MTDRIQCHLKGEIGKAGNGRGSINYAH